MKKYVTKCIILCSNHLLAAEIHHVLCFVATGHSVGSSTFTFPILLEARNIRKMFQTHRSIFVECGLYLEH